MEKINLFDINNKRVQVYLVRFFKYNNDKYLIYTLNEQDMKGYVKLYLVKVIQDFGRSMSYHISDNEEWKHTQAILKNILSELKYNKPRAFEDLNTNLINGMRVEKTRVFKFEKKLVDLLSSSNPTNSLEKGASLDSSKKEDATDITEWKNQYEVAQREIERLNSIMGDLLAENIRYKTKYGELDS